MYSGMHAFMNWAKSFNSFFAFKAPLDFEEMKFPFSGFLPYHWGKRVNTSRPLDLTDIKFGVQIFGGVYEDYKQKGSGFLDIQWVKAYKE